MNPALLIQILQILLVAEPEVVSAIHNLLTGASGKADVDILNQDVIDWQAVQTKAKAQLGL
jgi:hypothetical protein